MAGAERQPVGRAGGQPEGPTDSLLAWVERVPFALSISRRSDGKILHVNPAFCALFRYRADELIGVAAESLYYDAAERRRVQAEFQKKGILQDWELRLRRSDGAGLWCAVSVSAARFSGEEVLVVWIHDITERREAETALRRSQELFRTVFDESPLGIAFLGPEGQFIAVNRAFCRALDRTESELHSRDFSDVIHPEDGPATRDWIVGIFGGGPAGEILERRCIRRDGEIVWMRIHLSAPTYGRDGRPFVLAILEDISERKRIEQQLAHSQKMEALGQLAGGIAHDFNNLLTVITGYTDRLLRDLPPASELRSKAIAIEKAAASASLLTGQLLTFSRKQARRARAVDVNETLRVMSDMLARLLAEHIEIRTRFAPDLGMVEADPTQLEQIVINLAVNARDAMPDGGTLSIETTNVERNGPFVMLRIADTGYGMDPATMSRIFEPFFTTKEQGRGTGMGLSTVYGIVKQSDGYIEVNSTPGAGTEFRIYLPRIPQQPQDRAAGDGCAAFHRAAQETVLLVEDAQLVRTLVGEILRGSGYRVVEAADGIEALDVCARHSGPIDLLVSDVAMPRMSGTELAAQIGAARPGIKVLFLSAHTGYFLDEIARLKPGAGFLQKPFSPDALLRKVRSILGEG